MPFEIEFTETAADHIRASRKYDQSIILDGIEEQLANEAAPETRNRKRLSDSDLSAWELRVQDFRVFYDIVKEENLAIVKVKAVGQKVHSKLYIGGKEVRL